MTYLLYPDNPPCFLSLFQTTHLASSPPPSLPPSRPPPPQSLLPPLLAIALRPSAPFFLFPSHPLLNSLSCLCLCL